jgi:hypothetical protein
MYVQTEERHEAFYDVVPFLMQVISKTALKCRDVYLEGKKEIRERKNDTWGFLN